MHGSHFSPTMQCMAAIFLPQCNAWQPFFSHNAMRGSHFVRTDFKGTYHHVNNRMFFCSRNTHNTEVVR